VLNRFVVPTCGLLPPLGEHAIDHIAHSSDLQITDLSTIARQAPDGTLS